MIRARRSPGAIVVIFLVAYAALQALVIAAHGSALERWIIEQAGVRTSVTLIGWLTPRIGATANGASIIAPDATLNIRPGCEGTEILIPLFAALLAYPFSWRTRVFGLLMGTGWVFVLNQARILGLFYAFRADPELFGSLHGFVAPLLLILGVAAFFFGVLQWDRQRAPARASSPSAC
jgi:exosortase family protein XrtM